MPGHICLPTSLVNSHGFIGASWAESMWGQDGCQWWQLAEASWIFSECLDSHPYYFISRCVGTLASVGASSLSIAVTIFLP